MVDKPEEPRAPVDYLKLVHLSDVPTRYDYVVKVGTPMTMTTPEDHPAYNGKFNFEEFRLKESLVIRAENMVRHLEQEGVHNYNYQYQGDTVDFSFATVLDANIARMFFMPDREYEVGLSPDDPDASLEEVEMIMSHFQQQFNLNGMSQHVQLRLDTRNKQILAIASSRRALVDIIGDEYHLAPATLDL